jgi:hypothetical protein
MSPILALRATLAFFHAGAAVLEPMAKLTPPLATMRTLTAQGAPTPRAHEMMRAMLYEAAQILLVTLRRWSVQPCVRPVSAVCMTAGHNALRGSDPGQQ